MTECEMCGYYWQKEGEEYPRCQFEGPEGWAPCEAEEDDYLYEGEE
jgi:hypothetical protein